MNVWWNTVLTTGWLQGNPISISWLKKKNDWPIRWGFCDNTAHRWLYRTMRRKTSQLLASHQPNYSIITCQWNEIKHENITLLNACYSSSIESDGRSACLEGREGLRTFSEANHWVEFCSQNNHWVTTGFTDLVSPSFWETLSIKKS